MRVVQFREEIAPQAVFTTKEVPCEVPYTPVLQ
jgi:hypothetical protein